MSLKNKAYVDLDGEWGEQHLPAVECEVCSEVLGYNSSEEPQSPLIVCSKCVVKYGERFFEVDPY